MNDHSCTQNAFKLDAVCLYECVCVCGQHERSIFLSVSIWPVNKTKREKKKCDTNDAKIMGEKEMKKIVQKRLKNQPKEWNEKRSKMFIYTHLWQTNKHSHTHEFMMHTDTVLLWVYIFADFCFHTSFWRWRRRRRWSSNWMWTRISAR